jgi:Leucine-rich repeat (LRR) protein
MKKLYQILFTLITVYFVSGNTAGSQDAMYYYDRGLKLIAATDYVGAINEFTLAISANQDFADAYFQRAVAKDLLSKKENVGNSELCFDLLKAAMLGYDKATKLLVQKSQSHCYNLKTAFHDPEVVFCADFSSSVLSELPTQAKDLEMLMSLNLFNNRISHISEQVYNFDYLVYLNLCSNEITQISPKISQLTLLTELNLNKNKLTNIPKEVCLLPSLKVLSLHDNHLSSLPADIVKNKSIEVLDLSKNNFTVIPEFLEHMHHLKELNLSGNKLDPKAVELLRKMIPGTKIYF